MKKRVFAIFLMCLAVCSMMCGAVAAAGISTASNESFDWNGDGSLGGLDAICLAEAIRNGDFHSVFEVIAILKHIVSEETNTVSLIGDVKNALKITEDLSAGTILLRQKALKTSSPAFTFYLGDAPLEGEAFAVSGTIRAETKTGYSGHIQFTAYHDQSNLANFIINRRVGGVNGVYRNITVDGKRTPNSGNQKVSEGLVDTTDWTAEFAFVFDHGQIELYLKESGEEYQLMASYETDWATASAQFKLIQYADVTLSDIKMETKNEEVSALRNVLKGLPENPIASLKLLFIGNSATYVNEIPQTLSRLAGKAGYDVEVNSLTSGGYTLAQHADSTTDHGKEVLKEIAKGYDIVILQEHSNCIESEEKRQKTFDACRVLDQAIRESGAKTYLYIRPPTGGTKAGYDSYGQCFAYGSLFEDIAAELEAECVFVNRAYAYAIKNFSVPLWAADNAHTSPEGAYMAVCVFFSTLFDTSTAVFDSNGLAEATALALQQAADKIVLDGFEMSREA